MKRTNISLICACLLAAFACQPDESPPGTEGEPLFEQVPASQSGVSFSNDLSESEQVNYFTYPYLYNGAGVAVGDLNNDGLQDLYFTANIKENRLYLNKGGMAFEDVTQSAGTCGDSRWYTGVTMADVNADGYLDIYLSVAGRWETTANQLWINNGDLTFTERAEEFGLADTGHSTQATFFDYDRDGDLDCYVANYPPTRFDAPNFVYSQNLRNAKLEKSDRLYRNDQGRFTDVTKEAGLVNFGLSLSATVADLNNDGWPDLYVSNDFASPDFLYMNNGDGTFTETLEESIAHAAFYGMGVDIADFNNDGWADILQVDMTPEDNYRSKANMASMNIPQFREMVDLGLQHQYMENALQVNFGVTESGSPRFGDASRMTGMALTDWSWSPLFADLDNDGLRDVFITNGVRREINNKDFFIQLEKQEKYFKNQSMSAAEQLRLTKEMPSQAVANYAFRNKGGLQFENVAQEWGLAEAGFSNGSAYADLDNDGDLDLVTNNVDAPASVYRNRGTANRWLRIRFDGPDANRFGIGAKVIVNTNAGQFVSENMATRGYQSASEPIVHVGLGEAELAQSVRIIWPDGKTQLIEQVTAGQTLTARYGDATETYRAQPQEPQMFASAKEGFADPFTHRENEHDDFIEEVLLPHRTSRHGPGLAVGDVNGDGRQDFYIGGAKGQAGAIFTQNAEGKFVKQPQEALLADRSHEDVGALFFDANGDGTDDLYVVSGGSEAEKDSEFYQDRLYLNRNGKLERASEALPRLLDSGGRVKACDFDRDGDIDLLVGGRLVPKAYGFPAATRLLVNESSKEKASFRDATEAFAPMLLNAGMVTDFAWTDIDEDGWQDLIVVGEWMPVTALRNSQGSFEDWTERLGFGQLVGWWFSVAQGDFNEDGHEDLVLGNLGTNYKYQASDERTFDLYVSDFDENGHHDIVLSYANGGKEFPLRGRSCSSEQMPSIKKKFKDYHSFASATLEDVYGAEKLQEALFHYQARTFASQLLIHTGENAYRSVELPDPCQLSAIQSTVVTDVNGDGHQDLLMAGNLYVSEVETKRNDASIGQCLLGDGKGNFEPLHLSLSGFYAPGDVREIALVRTPSHATVLIANNNGPLEALNFHQNPKIQ